MDSTARASLARGEGIAHGEILREFGLRKYYPVEDEPISEEEERALDVSKAWLKTYELIPHEEVLAELGLTPEDFARMSRTPLDRRDTNRYVGRKIGWSEQGQADLRAPSMLASAEDEDATPAA